MLMKFKNWVFSDLGKSASIMGLIASIIIFIITLYISNSQQNEQKDRIFTLTKMLEETNSELNKSKKIAESSLFTTERLETKNDFLINENNRFKITIKKLNQDLNELRKYISNEMDKSAMNDKQRTAIIERIDKSVNEIQIVSDSESNNEFREYSNCCKEAESLQKKLEMVSLNPDRDNTKEKSTIDMLEHDITILKNEIKSKNIEIERLSKSMPFVPNDCSNENNQISILKEKIKTFEKPNIIILDCSDEEYNNLLESRNSEEELSRLLKDKISSISNALKQIDKQFSISSTQDNSDKKLTVSSLSENNKDLMIVASEENLLRILSGLKTYDDEKMKYRLATEGNFDLFLIALEEKLVEFVDLLQKGNNNYEVPSAPKGLVIISKYL